MQVLSFYLAISIVIFHMLSNNFRFLSSIPRSKYLSFFGGVSIAYVFVEVLPNLNKHQQNIEKETHYKIVALAEDHAYIMAMIGFFVFLGMERLVLLSKTVKKKGDDYESLRVFWIHIASFFIYNGLIGYILRNKDFASAKEMLLYFFAVFVHIISNDRGIRDDHQNIYDKAGRKLLSFAVLIGWSLGGIIEISQLALSTVFAFISGGIIINAMKEEIPKERKSSFLTFTVGSLLYTVLLVISA
ncbi:hypothetical protein [Niallia sp. 03133]|uniref:hypothetical protein n=1 Tax=Niallia sp. 03133 TaxID=3458060 RepID=UPI0040440289